MNYAPVLPPKVAVRVLQRVQPAANFMYAPYAFEDAAYLEYFTHAPNVVIDNPVYERGAAVTPAQLAYLITKVRPNFAFMPDIVDDLNGTLRLAQGFLTATAGPSLAAVLQGKNMSELRSCAAEFYNYGIRRFGISIFTPRHFGILRPDLTTEVLEALGDKVYFHWLGADYPYEDNKWFAGHENVISCDSAEAFNFAYNHNGYMPTGSRQRSTWFADIDYVSQYTVRRFKVEAQRMQTWFSTPSPDTIAPSTESSVPETSEPTSQ